MIGNVSSRDQVVTDSELQALAGYDASDPDGDGWDGYYRFRGGQDTSMNSGQPFTSVQFHGHSFDMGGGFMATSGDGIVLLKKPRTVVADIEIDDSSGPTSPGSDKAVFEWKLAAHL